MADPSKGLAAVEFDERFLDASWRWLNDPEVRWLTRTPVFTREEQRAWFASLASRQDYCIWGMELRGVPIGVFGLKHIEKESAECWAYIGERGLWGRGFGVWEALELIKRAKLKGLQRVYFHVLEGNSVIIRIAKALGFVEVGRDGAVLRMEMRLCPWPVTASRLCRRLSQRV